MSYTLPIKELKTTSIRNLEFIKNFFLDLVIWKVFYIKY